MMPAKQSPSPRTMRIRALVHAALIIGLAVAMTLRSPDYVSRETTNRILGIVTGFFVLYYANAASKTLAPLSRIACDPATEQMLRRFMAWALVLGSLGYILPWVFAPFKTAMWLAPALLATALLTVGIRIGMRKRGSRA